VNFVIRENNLKKKIKERERFKKRRKREIGDKIKNLEN
jgi:hypothetical protein